MYQTYRPLVTAALLNESVVEPTDAMEASVADETVLYELSFYIPMQYNEPPETYFALGF